jgi:hypothetical protein
MDSEFVLSGILHKHQLDISPYGIQSSFVFTKFQTTNTVKIQTQEKEKRTTV